MPEHSRRRPKHRSPRLGLGTKVVIAVVGIGVVLTGGSWLLFHHFLVEQGEFGPEPNPLEPWWLTLHGAFAFAAVWVLGLLWGVHVSAAWPLSRRRFSGGILAAVMAWLSVSGYLLYYVGDDRIRSIVSILHWGGGLACPVFYLLHRYRAFASLLKQRSIGALSEIRSALGFHPPLSSPGVAFDRKPRSAGPSCRRLEIGCEIGREHREDARDRAVVKPRARSDGPAQSARR